jgi:hypothetical protein
MRDYRGGSKSNGDGNGNGNGECRAPPSRDFAATALVLTAEAAATLIANNGWTDTKEKDHFVVFPVALLQPCCARVQFVQCRICDNLLSSSSFPHLQHI